MIKYLHDSLAKDFLFQFSNWYGPLFCSSVLSLNSGMIHFLLYLGIWEKKNCLSFYLCQELLFNFIFENSERNLF